LLSRRARSLRPIGPTPRWEITEFFGFSLLLCGLCERSNGPSYDHALLLH
jgi:hypothetical protein